MTVRSDVGIAMTGLIAGLTLLALIPVVFGAPLPMVVITWKRIDPASRSALEQRFHLAEASPLSNGRWQYLPLDTSPATLRGIVQHPAVATTDGINRTRFTMSAHAPLTARRGGLVTSPRGARLVKAIAYLLFALAALPLLAMAAQLAGIDVQRVRGLKRAIRDRPRQTLAEIRTAVVQALEYGVPSASAEAAAAFRIVFGALVLAYVISKPAVEVGLTPAVIAETHGPQRAVATLALSHPGLAALFDDAVRLAAALFIAGALTRAASIALAVTFIAWATIFTANASHHMVAAMGVTLLCLIAAPLGHAWSLDAWVRRRIGHTTPRRRGKQYGFAFWIPGFVFGVAFLAAAWSKVGGGPAWILNGTVRYHFITDLPHALVPWGPVITRYYPIAVAMSAAAVVVECGLIVASFTRSLTLRLVLGLSAAALLTGFALFQGVVWPAWWILLTSFLPWSLIRPQADTGSGTARLLATQRVVIVLVIAVQAVVSAAAIELRPLLTAYDMYATTYGSPDEYTGNAVVVYHLVLADRGGVRERRDCEMPEAAVWQLTGSQSWEDLVPALATLPAACQRAALDADTVTLVGDRRVIDWNTGWVSWDSKVAREGPFVRKAP